MKYWSELTCLRQFDVETELVRQFRICVPAGPNAEALFASHVCPVVGNRRNLAGGTVAREARGIIRSDFAEVSNDAE